MSVGKRFGKRGEAFEQALRKEPVKLPVDGHIREGRRSLPCGPLFKLDKNRGTKLVEPAPKKLIATAVGLLGTADIFRQFEQGGFIKQRCAEQNFHPCNQARGQVLMT